MGPCEDVSEEKLSGQVERETFPGNFPLAFSTGKLIVLTELTDWGRRRFEAPRQDPAPARVLAENISALGQYS